MQRAFQFFHGTADSFRDLECGTRRLEAFDMVLHGDFLSEDISLRWGWSMGAFPVW